MAKVVVFLRNKWWLIMVIAIIAILLLIPTRSGLPDKNYKGCENSNSQYKSYCLNTKIKSISQEANGSISFTVPVEFSDGTQDVTFILQKGRGLKVGDEVFINLAEWDKKAYLFINGDSNLLFTILSTIFNGSQAATAVIDLNTMTEIKTSP